MKREGAVKSESRIQSEILAAIGSMPDVRVWRNEVAGAWVGQKIGETREGHAVIKNARHIQAGLCKGSSDLIGIGPGGRFLAMEVKKPGGSFQRGQREYLEAVRYVGGIGAVARSVEEALQVIEAARAEAGV